VQLQSSRESAAGSPSRVHHRLCFPQGAGAEAIATLRQGAVTGGLHTRTLLGFVLARSGQRMKPVRSSTTSSHDNSARQRGFGVPSCTPDWGTPTGLHLVQRAVDRYLARRNPLLIEIMDSMEGLSDPRFDAESQRSMLSRSNRDRALSRPMISMRRGLTPSQVSSTPG